MLRTYENTTGETIQANGTDSELNVVIFETQNKSTYWTGNK